MEHNISVFMETFRSIIINRYKSDSCERCGKIVWFGDRKMFSENIIHQCIEKRSRDIFKLWVYQFVGLNLKNTAEFFLDSYNLLHERNKPSYDDYVAYIDFVQIINYTLCDFYTIEWVKDIYRAYRDLIMVDKYDIMSLFDEFDYHHYKDKTVGRLGEFINILHDVELDKLIGKMEETEETD